MGSNEFAELEITADRRVRVARSWQATFERIDGQDWNSALRMAGLMVRLARPQCQ